MNPTKNPQLRDIRARRAEKLAPTAFVMAEPKEREIYAEEKITKERDYCARYGVCWDCSRGYVCRGIARYGMCPGRARYGVLPLPWLSDSPAGRARQAERKVEEAAKKKRAEFRAKHPILGTIKALGNAILAGIACLFVILLSFVAIWAAPFVGLIFIPLALWWVVGTVYEEFTGKTVL